MSIERNDKVFEYILIDILKPYTEAARDWWSKYANKAFPYTTSFPIKGAPIGMYEKCCRSPRMSPLYGIQAFPIVRVAQLNLPRMTGGATKQVERIAKDGLEIDEFTVIAKIGLQSTLRSGMFLCYVPTDRLRSATQMRWVYLKPSEMLELVNGIVTSDVIERITPFIEEYQGDDGVGIGEEIIGITGNDGEQCDIMESTSV